MKRIYLLLLSMLLANVLMAQLVGFRAGYTVNFNPPVGGDPNDSNFIFQQAFYASPEIWTYVTGTRISSVPNGTTSIIKTGDGGASSFMIKANAVGYADIDPDFKTYPYTTIRIRSSATAPVPTNWTLKSAGTPGMARNFTLKGNNEWQVIRMDYGDQALIYSNEGAWTFSEGAAWAGAYPYTIEIDYIKFGSHGDPDPLVPVTFNSIKDTVIEKDAGEQLITLKGITGGADVTKLSFSQTNTKASLFQSISFEAINLVDSTATLKITPTPGTIGSASINVLLTYNDGDTIKKYKMRTFQFNIVADPKMTINTLTSAQYNQPKATINITGATNGTGGASGLEIEVSTDNPDLITSLVAQPVANDGTSKITWIPASDQCGTGTITAIINDLVSGRSAEYTIEAKVKDIDGGDCLPIENINIGSVNELTVSPNPASEKVVVTMPDNKGGLLNVIDITGCKVMQVSIQPGDLEQQINVSNLNPGVYFIVHQSSQKVKKMIIK